MSSRGCVECIRSLGCCSCHCHMVSLLNSDSAQPRVFLCSHQSTVAVAPATPTWCRWATVLHILFPLPHTGFHEVMALLVLALLPSHWAQSRTLDWGTEAIGVFSQSHPPLQLALPHDSPGWCGSQIINPDCPWTLEFPWGLRAISSHGTSGVAISSH